MYYTQEGYDDFYYGKGSTYPDANGCIGILFEQASSRGHLQKTDNGELSFPFTIRNQVTTALSTQKAALEMRKDLLDYQKRFYQDAIKEADQDSRKAFVFGEAYDDIRLSSFLTILARHQIDVYRLAKDIDQEGMNFKAEHSFVVPLRQTQYRLIRGMFDKVTSFQDSLFYDVSSWTLPLAFNINYTALESGVFNQDLLGYKVVDQEVIATSVPFKGSEYAYLLEWDDYLAPLFLNRILDQGLRAKVATLPLKANNKEFPAGTIMIPAHNQQVDQAQTYKIIKKAIANTGVEIKSVSTGFTIEGIDLGSNDFRLIQQPKVLLVVGDGVSSYEAGEAWHLLDQRYGVVVTKVETNDLGRFDLDRYNKIIMVDGSYRSISKRGADKIKSWVARGGTLIAIKRAVQWAKNKGIAQIEFRRDNSSKKNAPRRPYEKLGQDNGANVIGGAIFEAKLDLTNPIAFGFRQDKLPVFRRGTLFFEPARNAYATPLIYTADPLLSGYISQKNLNLIKNSAGIVISGTGQGKVICMADNPNFRAFWYGTNKLFANALFFGNIINGQAVEKVPGKASIQASEEEDY